MRKSIIGKRGDASIGIFVLLVLVLCLSVLFIFVRSNGSLRDIAGNTIFVSDALSNEQDIYYYSREIAVDSIVSNYFSSVEKGNLKSGDFESLVNSKINGDFVNGVKGIKFGEGVLKSSFDKIILGKPEFKFSNGILKANLPEVTIRAGLVDKGNRWELIWLYEQVLAQTAIIHNSKLNFEVNLSEVGLPGFDSIEKARIDCSSRADYGKCFNEILGGEWNVGKREVGKDKFFDVSSKRMFFVNGELKVLSFILKE